MARSEDFDEPIELDDEMLAPGKQLKPAPKPVTPYQEWSAEPLPERLTAKWVRGQVPDAIWKAHRSKNGALTPEAIVYMAELRGRGLSQRGVMARLGLSLSTWDMWKAKAKEGMQPYVVWAQCMGHAEASMEEELLDNVRNAAGTDWKASTWLLGKLQPQEYSDKAGGNTTINVNGDVNNKQMSVNSLDNSKIAEILGIFEEIDVNGEKLVLEGEVVEDE